MVRMKIMFKFRITVYVVRVRLWLEPIQGLGRKHNTKMKKSSINEPSLPSSGVS